MSIHKNIVIAVTVMAVTLLTGCEKKDVTPVADPELELGYWEITAQSMSIKITAIRDGGHKSEYVISRGMTEKVGYVNTNSIVVSCTDANGCAFTVNGNFYNSSVRLERGVN